MQIQALEKVTQKEKRLRYKGSARIRLNWLYFPNKPNDLNEKIAVGSMCAITYLPLHGANQQDFESALRVSGMAEGVLPANSPELGFWPGYRLECLYGRHRLQAAK